MTIAPLMENSIHRSKSTIHISHKKSMELMICEILYTFRRFKISIIKILSFKKKVLLKFCAPMRKKGKKYAQ